MESQEITNVFPSGAAFKASAATLAAILISFCRCPTLCCHNIAATIGLRTWGVGQLRIVISISAE